MTLQLQVAGRAGAHEQVRLADPARRRVVRKTRTEHEPSARSQRLAGTPLTLLARGGAVDHRRVGVQGDELGEDARLEVDAPAT